MNQYYQDCLIRDWQPGDRAAVSHLVKTVLAEYGMTFEPEKTDQDAVQVETAYWQTGGEFWVVEHQGAIVGSAGYHPSHWASQPGQRGAELRKMFLLPDYRGRGLGQFLLAELERSAAEKGFHEMWLETATVLQAAVRLYERSGYQPSTGVETQRCDRLYYKPLRVL